MKRSAGINPVYPYEEKKSNLMPPFFDPQGLSAESGGKVLSLKVQDPFTFENQGNLALKLGDGLHVDENGNLVTGEDFTGANVIQPLHREGARLSLSYGAGLQSQEGALTVHHKGPLKIDGDGALTVGLLSPLKVYNGSVFLAVSTPLELTDVGTLGLNVGPGLDVRGNRLETSPIFGKGPISVIDREIDLQVGSGLEVRQSQLHLKTAPPLTKANNAVTLAVGKGLSTNSEGLLTLNAAPPFTLTKGKLALQLAPPLIVSNNKLSIPLGAGLEYKNGSLRVKAGSGIQVDAKTGVHTASPVDPSSIAIDQGLELTPAGAVRAKVESPVFISENGGITVRLGPGLKAVNDTIQFNLGNGMGLNLQNELISPGIDYTLWTGPLNFTRNILKPFTGTLNLTLTRAGSLIMGTVSVVGDGDFFTVMKNGSLTFQMLFDRNGELINKEDFSGPWGFRKGNEIDEWSTLNHLLLMPSIKKYPPGKRVSSSMYLTTVAQNAKEVFPFNDDELAANKNHPYKDCNLGVIFNYSDKAPFSLYFKWGPFKHTEVLDTSVANFMYMSDTFQ